MSELEQRIRLHKAEGLYPYWRIAESGVGPRVRYEGRHIVMLGSNDYLALSNDWRVTAAGARALRDFGAGQGGSPLVCGYTTLHARLEERLGRFMGRDACMLFATGYQANVGALAALSGRGDCVLCDSFVHASIVDGATLSRARLKRFRHNDSDHLRQLLRHAGSARTLVVVDGVYSMLGDLAALPEIGRIAREAGALLIIDDSHGFGLLGRDGRGTCEFLACEDYVDLITVSMSKALATTGGFVLGDADTIDCLRHNARAGIFSASGTPSSIATALVALDIIESEPWRRSHALNMAERVRGALRYGGLTVHGEHSAIVSVPVGDEAATLRTARELFDAGILAVPAVYPAVPRGSELLRFHFTAAHTAVEEAEAIAAMLSVCACPATLDPVVSKYSNA